MALGTEPTLNFPDSPYLGQVYTAYGEEWVWDSVKWVASSTGGGAKLWPPNATPPTLPSTGDLWWDTTSGNLFTYYDDGNSQQWVIAVDWVSGTLPPSSLPPASALPGMLWWDPNQGNLFVWYDDGNTAQWVIAINDQWPANMTGDVTATGPSSAPFVTTVVGLQGRPVASTAPTTNQVLTWSGTQWAPAAGGGGGGASITISDTAPASPAVGALWWDSVGGNLYLWYQDPNTSQWVIAINPAGLLPAGAVTYDWLVWNGTQWVNTRPKYLIGFSFTGGVLQGSQLLGLHKFSKAVTFQGNFGGYLGHAPQCGGTANATASTVLNVDRALAASPNTFSNIGTITIAAGGTNGTFATSGTVNFAQGDVLRLVGPATADGTFANPFITLVGYET